MEISFVDVSFNERIGDVEPTGVFVELPIVVENISDSALSIALGDFTLVDESGSGYAYSLHGTRARLGEMLISTDCPSTPLHLLCVKERPAVVQRLTEILETVKVTIGENTRLLLVFDIPPTGFSRQLKMRFRDGPLVPVEVPTPKAR